MKGNDSLEGTVKKSSFKMRFKAFFKSKFLVVATLILTGLGLFGGIAKTSADNIDLSGVYQYFLLDNQDGYSADDKKAAHDIKHPTGALGSGGNHARFNYTQIVDGAGSSNRASAKQFCSEMATLSGYHYFNVTDQGFNGMFNHAGTALEGLILVPFGLIFDLSGVIYHLFSNAIVKYNVFTLLANVFANSGVGSGLADAFGISASFLKDVFSLLLSLFSILMIIAVVKALSHEDAFSMTHWKKILLRIVGFLAMPVTVMFCSMLINDLTADSLTVGKQDPVFANYIINTQTWAKDNFNMNIGGAKEISGDTKDGTYLDPNWNPYADNGKNAAQIGQALFKEGPLSGTAFPNTALAVQLMRNGTFSAQDYLSYIESTSNANGVKTALNGFGKNAGNVYDFSVSYSSMGTKEPNWAIKDTPITCKDAPQDYEASDDAKTNTSHRITSPVETWVDRYIYGAKNTGDLNDYYSQSPSNEQVYADFGGNSSGGQRLSDASTFLALNTKFDTEGGTFSLNNPAQGIKGTVASFAYQTPVWSSYCLIGSPLYTLPEVIGEGIFTLIVLMAIMAAIFRVGLIEMNMDPLRAWALSVGKGDIEYTYASVIYALGIMGTVIMMNYVGPVFGTALNKIVNVLFTPLTQNITFSQTGTPSVGGTELIGLSGIVTFIVALFALRLYAKDKKFRDGIADIMIWPWDIASEKGHQLEAQVSGNVSETIKKSIRNRAERGEKMATKRADMHSKFNTALDSMAKGDTRGGRLANKITGGLAGKVARGLNATKKQLDPNADVDTTGGLSKAEALKREMRTEGAQQRLENALAAMPSDKKLDKNVDKALDDLDNDQVPYEADEDGMLDVDDPRLTDEQQAEAEDINAQQAALDGEQEDLDTEQEALDREREELERQHDAGEISDEEYEKRKADLDARQAAHDAKQADHDMKQNLLNDRRNDLQDAVNGTASLNHEGKFNLDNPNLTDEERQEAGKLNEEQDTINHENSAIAEEQQAIDHDQEELNKDKKAYEQNKDHMSPEERSKTRKELASRQREISERQDQLDERKKANDNKQEALMLKQTQLMDKVKIVKIADKQ